MSSHMIKGVRIVMLNDTGRFKAHLLAYIERHFDRDDLEYYAAKCLPDRPERRVPW